MKTADSLIAHVDLDAFFASCEQRDNPEYRGKPLIVGALPGGRGVVAACSYEAREFGLHSAMPISQAYKRCPDGIYVRPDMRKYREESRRIMGLLDSITPIVEKASIDEAYLDISGLEKVTGTPAEIGQQIRDKIYRETGLTASVGIGPNRLIAKLGSEACKPDGLKVVPASEVEDFLAPMPVSNLRGMGKQTLKKADKLGVRKVELDELLARIRALLRRADAGDTVVLRVDDLGPGIPEQERERIFEPFYRVQGTRETGEGFGLGLALAHRSWMIGAGVPRSRRGTPTG